MYSFSRWCHPAKLPLQLRAEEVHKTLIAYSERASALRRPLLTIHERLIEQLSAGAYLLAQFLLSPRSQVHLPAVKKSPPRREKTVEERAMQE